jgi:hypothetical protein
MSEPVGVCFVFKSIFNNGLFSIGFIQKNFKILEHQYVVYMFINN